ncbi:hypothetical protein [Raoultibacter timonensis]|uniref:hypothetical protein n=1 Tax=Raoultibacter timonensis TaxID=1907662 RepID=UPI0026DB34C2|nr:hypothetical protein [Raoultibacter timonensis]
MPLSIFTSGVSPLATQALIARENRTIGSAQKKRAQPNSEKPQANALPSEFYTHAALNIS